MTPSQAIVLASAFLAVGLWLMLPRRQTFGTGVGAALAIFAIAGMILAGGLAGQLLRLGSWPDVTVFWLLASTTIVSALAAVTMRSPVYCALWFALTLLGTAGLLLLIGAQFLALATVAVYAGAIVVTFLFVLMLAQPQGYAYYDRLSWDGFLSAATGALLVGILTAALTAGLDESTLAGGPTCAERKADVLAEDHVARLGGRLFSEHLISVEVAGVLLMVALIGAAAIVGQRRDVRLALNRETGSVTESDAPGGSSR